MGDPPCLCTLASSLVRKEMEWACTRRWWSCMVLGPWSQWGSMVPLSRLGTQEPWSQLGMVLERMSPLACTLACALGRMSRSACTLGPWCRLASPLACMVLELACLLACMELGYLLRGTLGSLGCPLKGTQGPLVPLAFRNRKACRSPLACAHPSRRSPCRSCSLGWPSGMHLKAKVSRCRRQRGKCRVPLDLLTSVVENLEDGWAGNGVVVRWGCAVLGEDNVCLTWLSLQKSVNDNSKGSRRVAYLLWDGHLVGDAVSGGNGGLNGTTWEGDEVGLGRLDLLGHCESQNVTWLGNASWGDGNGWVGLEWQAEGSSLAIWAGLDERSSQRENVVEALWDVERSWEWRQWVGDLVVTEVGRVAGLDGEDGTSGGEVVWAGDELSSTEVGADTDTLEEVGGGEEALHIGVAELVLALLGWDGTGL